MGQNNYLAWIHMETICIFPDEQERQELFAYLNELEIEYRKPYKRFNQAVKVPRGQASSTLHDNIKPKIKRTNMSSKTKHSPRENRSFRNRTLYRSRETGHFGALHAVDIHCTFTTWIRTQRHRSRRKLS